MQLQLAVFAPADDQVTVPCCSEHLVGPSQLGHTLVFALPRLCRSGDGEKRALWGPGVPDLERAVVTAAQSLVGQRGMG